MATRTSWDVSVAVYCGKDSHPEPTQRDRLVTATRQSLIGRLGTQHRKAICRHHRQAIVSVVGLRTGPHHGGR